MQFGTKNVNNEVKVSPYISWGKNELRITKLEIKTASTGSKRVDVSFESQTVTSPGFTPAEEATAGGKIGRAALSGWLKSDSPYYDKSVETLNRKIGDIADALGKRDQINAIEANNLEEYITKLNTVLVGGFAHYVLAAEFYQGQDKEGNPKEKFVLNLPNFKFVSKEDNLEFHKDKLYHYKPLVVEGSNSDSGTSQEATW